MFDKLFLHDSNNTGKKSKFIAGHVTSKIFYKAKETVNKKKNKLYKGTKYTF